MKFITCSVIFLFVLSWSVTLKLNAQAVPIGGCKIWQDGHWVEVPCNPNPDGGNIRRGKTRELTQDDKEYKSASDYNEMGRKENKMALKDIDIKDWDEAFFHFQLAIQYYQLAVDTHPAEKTWQENLDRNKQWLKYVAGKLFDEAFALNEKGLYREAELKYRMSIKFYSKNANVYNNLALILWNQGRYAAAADEFQMAIDTDPNAQNFKDNLIKLRAFVGNQQNAVNKRIADQLMEEDRLKALQLKNEENNIYKKGKDFYDEKNYAEAESFFRKALELNPNNINAYLFLAGSVSLQDRWKEAENIYKKIIELDPKNNSAYFCLIIQLENEGLFEESKTVIRKAMEIDPASSDYYTYSLGEILKKQGRYKEAEKEYQNALKINPNYNYAQEAIDELVKSGKIKDEKAVINAIESVYGKAPHGVSEWVRKGFQAVETNHWDVAKSSFQDALRLDPTNEGLKKFVEIFDITAVTKPMTKKRIVVYHPNTPSEKELNQFFKEFNLGVFTTPPSDKLLKYVRSMPAEEFRAYLKANLSNKQLNENMFENLIKMVEQGTPK